MSDENETTKVGMSIWEHLGELLSRLKIILFSVLISGLLIGFFPTNLEEILSSFDFSSPTILNYTPFISIIMERMKSDLLPSGAELIAGNLMDTAYIYLILSFMVGIVVCSPLIAYELYAFFNPALLGSERKMMGTYIFAFIALFVFGIVLGYTMILPITFRIIMWFIYTAGALPYINIKDFFMMVITLIMGSGLLYTAPIFLVLLAEKGIITSKHLTDNRKMIYVGFLVVIAVITPDPTIITDLIIMVPFIVVFEMAIVFSRRVEKKDE